MSLSRRLEEVGIELPRPVKPIGAYIPAKASRGLIVTSGQLPITTDGVVMTGRLGEDLDVDAGARAARVAVINALAAAAHCAGGVDQLTSVFKVVVFVNATPDFVDHARVANGASDLLGEIFGDQGRHVRSAVGMSSLPLGAAVEIELSVETR